MATLVRMCKGDWHWFALLALTFLVNLPTLAPSLLVAGDTLHAFIFFQFAYGELLLHNELPRWLPYLGYGCSFDFNLFATIQPTDYVMMAVGWLCRSRNALLLYKISLILSESVLILGLYLLSKKLFTSKLTVWMVCLGGLLTTNSFFTTPWSLTAYYMVPLLLWFVLRFLESGRPAYLWLAGLTEGLSLLGTVPYIAPLHLFIVLAFLVPFLCRDPGLWRLFVNWRNFVHPLFFVFCGYFLLVGLWIEGIDVVWTAPGREKSGNVPLDLFLGRESGFERQPLGVMLRTLIKGDIFYGESINYVGLLPLAGLGYALMRRRDTLFLSLACVALALAWFSLGGWLSTLTYYCVPMMNKYRYISAAWNFLRIFLLLLGGVGFDQLLLDLRGLPAPAPASLSPRARWTITVALTCCVLDHLVHGNAAFFTTMDFVFQGQTHADLFSRQNAGISVAGFKVDGQTLLRLRFLVYAAILGLLCALLLRLRRARAEPAALARFSSWIGAVGPVLFALYLADVGFFFSQYLKQCPWCPPGMPVEDTMAVSDTVYRPQRYELDFLPLLGARTLGLIDCPQGPWLASSGIIAWRLHKLPADAERIRQVMICPRSGITMHNFYGSACVIMQADFVVPWERLDFMMAGVKKMMDVRGRLQQPMEEKVAGDEALRRFLGEGLDKARMISSRDVLFADNEPQAVDIFSRLPDPDQKIVIQGTPPRAPVDESAAYGKVEPTQFTANRVVFKLPTAASGWLVYTDAFDPAWKATIDGQLTQVCRANIGFKAVYVPKGAQEVTFFFDAGRRDRHYLALVAVAASLALVLTGLLVAAPWVLRTGPVPNSMAPAAAGRGAPANWRLPLLWSAFAALAALTGGLFIGSAYFYPALLVVAAAAALAACVATLQR